MNVIEFAKGAVDVLNSVHTNIWAVFMIVLAVIIAGMCVILYLYGKDSAAISLGAIAGSIMTGSFAILQGTKPPPQTP